MSAANAIWITGVGTVTPFGGTPTAFADGVLAGRSAVTRVTSFDVTDHPSQIAGLVGPVACPDRFDPAESAAFARLHRLEQLNLWCCCEALTSAGWWDKRRDVRIGLILGLGAEWLLRWECDALSGGRELWQAPREGAEALTGRARSLLGLTGPAASISAACASGNHALAQAREWLRLGWVDVCVAGACDAAVTPISLAGFGNLRALSRRNMEPQAASRPFDRGRDGFVMGEGGAVFVLERAATARRRGANALAEVAGFGAASDAHNMVIPSPDPAPAVTAMRAALMDAQVNADQVDYVNAHATSTPVGDAAEARVLQSVFGHSLQRVPVSSTKSMTGHMLTAAAAVEALACVVAMKHQALPPTINLDEVDPECQLCHVPNEAQPRVVRVAVSNSFGFGGSNTCLVLRAV
jgi:3-oxoacyl-[acyl-carrier-protein] synthase II